ncbi:hypothetical protein [Paenibacillus sp. y28]|uniref:hypothetical protein n=1 Tax=Paenibacillus sp. y28 TaxID=3129110 RepID=UPI003017D724
MTIYSGSLFHYYEAASGPFRNLSDLPIEEAERVQEHLRKRGTKLCFPAFSRLFNCTQSAGAAGPDAVCGKGRTPCSSRAALYDARALSMATGMVR